jgi:tRNA G37 N-methylase Trm5
VTQEELRQALKRINEHDAYVPRKWSIAGEIVIAHAELIAERDKLKEQLEAQHASKSQLKRIAAQSGTCPICGHER